jgi:hypothetical protein
MAEATQFSFDLSEVATTLIKQQNLHEGRWLLAFEFQLLAGMMGTSPSDAKPGAMIQISRVQLVRKDNEPPDAPGLVDAAAVNPLSAKVPPKTK